MMPIPSLETIEKHKREVIDGLKKRGINLDGWTVEIEVGPWRSYDIHHEVDTNEKVIKLDVYSARYPATWYGWIEGLLTEIAEVLKKHAGA